MKNLFLFFLLFTGQLSYAQEKKYLVKDKKFSNREEIYKKLDKEIDKTDKIKDKKKAKKEVREAELRTLRKSKSVERELRESNTNNPVIKDFFKFKDSITQKKKIDGEEFDVLKDAEVLRDEIIKKRKEILNAYKQDANSKTTTETVPLENKNQVLYPLPGPKTSLLTRPSSPTRVVPVAPQVSPRKMTSWIWPAAGIIFAGILSFYVFKQLKKR